MGNVPLKTTEGAIKIIEVMRNQGYMTLKNITDRVDMKKPTVYNQLNTLKECGYVDKRGQEYALGLQFFSLGYDILNSLATPQEYDRHVSRVSEQTGFRSNIAVEENQVGYVISVSTGEYPNWGTQPMGRAFPLHSAAIGKAILAKYDNDQLNEYFDEHFPSGDAHRNTESMIKKDIKDIRENDIANVDDRGVIAKGIAFEQQGRIFAIGAHAPKNSETIEVSDSNLNDLLMNVKSELQDDINTK